MKRSSPLIVPVLILAGLLVAAGCHTAGIPGVRPPTWNDQLVATLEAESESSGPFLALNDEGAGSATQFKVGDVNGGAPSVVAAIQGNGASAGTKFAVELTDTYYLNLSIPIFGVIYVASAGTNAAGDAMEVRVIVRNGEKIVGGDSLTHNIAASNKMGKWNTIPISFRSEVSALEPGPLTIEVIRVSGLTDFIIGTGGTAQSFVEFRYFSSDPLSGTIYLDRGKFTSSGGEQVPEAEFNKRLEEFQASGGWDQAPPGYVRLPAPEETSEGGGAGPLAFVAFGALLSLGALLPRRRIPGKGAVAVLLVLALLTSGCFNGSNKSTPTATDDSQPTPTVNQTIEPRPDLGEAGIGAVDGFVHDEVGIAIKGAHVAFLGTNLFGKTDAKGMFAFEKVNAGVFVLRIDADKFAPLEQEVTVQSGAVTHLDITLVYPVAKQANDKAHIHDDWAGETVHTFADDAFTPTSRVYTAQQSTGATWYCDSFYEVDGSAASRRSHCEYPIPINMVGRRLFPGTSTVEVTLKWSGGPKELGLRVATSFNKTTSQIFLPRSSGTPFNVAVFPNEVDPGHQKFSTWEFYVLLPVTDVYYPASPPIYSGGSIGYTIRMHKGVVPYEPAHRDFWGNATELPITFNNNPLGGQSGGCYPQRTAGSVNGWNLKAPSLIPPGTAEIRGTFRWTHDHLDAVPNLQTQWELAYLTAVGPWSSTPFQLATLTPNGQNKYDFVIKPKPEETDQFYQFSSNWLLSPEDGETATTNCYQSTAYLTKWHLTAVAVKDPNFKDSA